MSRKNLSCSATVLLLSGLLLFGCNSKTLIPERPRVAVEVVGIVIDDSQGNSNGVIDAGETVQVRLKLKNPSRETLPAGEVRLFSSQAGVRVTQAIVLVAAIAPGQEPVTTGAFVFMVDKSFSGSNVAFHFANAQTALKIYQGTFNASVQPKQYSVEVVGVVIQDTISGSGNRDGRANPGEIFKMFVTLRNSGSDTIPAFQGILSTTLPGVDVTDNAASFTQILPGQSVTTTDPFECWLASSFTATSAAFLLSGPDFQVMVEPSGERRTLLSPLPPTTPPTPFAVMVYQNIAFCLERCAITRDALAPDNGTLRIRVAICNYSNNPFPPAKLEILANTIRFCDNPQIAFSNSNPAHDRVIYNLIDQNACGGPNDCAEEFVYSVPLKDVASESWQCIRFSAKVRTSCAIDNCDLRALNVCPDQGAGHFSIDLDLCGRTLIPAPPPPPQKAQKKKTKPN